jgi:hypothetical protein
MFTKRAFVAATLLIGLLVLLPLQGQAGKDGLKGSVPVVSPLDSVSRGGIAVATPKPLAVTGDCDEPIFEDTATIVQAGEAYTVIKHARVCFDTGPCGGGGGDDHGDDDDHGGWGIALDSSGNDDDDDHGDGDPCGPSSCDPFPNDGNFTYVYTLTNQGPLPVLGFEVVIPSSAVVSAGFVFGPGVNPSAVNIEANRVEWKFLAPVLGAGQTSDELYIVSPLGPDLVGVSVHGAGGLDTPAENVGPDVVCTICDGDDDHGDDDDDHNLVGALDGGDDDDDHGGGGTGPCFVCPSGLGAAPLAATASFDVELFGAAQSPPVNTSGWGTATITVDLDTHVVTIEGAFNDLDSAASGVNLRGAALPGENGPVILSVSFEAAVNGSFSGSGIATGPQLDAILEGHSYVNVESTTHPGGEIRAQVTSGCPGGDDDHDDDDDDHHDDDDDHGLSGPGSGGL